MPDGKGGYTRVSQDHLPNSTYDYNTPYGGQKYSHGVFIARSLSDASSHKSGSSKKSKKNNDLEGIDNYGYSGTIEQALVHNKPVTRSASDASALRHFAPPNAPEAIYAHPDKALRRASSYKPNPEEQKWKRTSAPPSSPGSPPPPLPPPPPPVAGESKDYQKQRAMQAAMEHKERLQRQKRESADEAVSPGAQSVGGYLILNIIS